MRRFLLPLILVPLTACDGGPLQGDWFVCEDVGCVSLASAGVRFDGESTWMPLAASGGNLEENEPYCHIADQGGSYSVEGDILTIVAPSSLVSGGTRKTAPAQDIAPAIMCQSDADCPSGSFCSPSALCEFPQTEPPPVEEPTDTTLKIRFELIDDRASFTYVDGSNSFIAKAVPTQDTLPCPSGINNVTVDAPRPSSGSSGTSSGSTGTGNTGTGGN